MSTSIFEICLQMPVRVAGADPGLYGAWALIVDGHLQEVVDMPLTETRTKGGKKFTGSEIVDTIKVDRDVDALAVANILWRWQPDHVFIEDVGTRPEQGIVSAFNFGFGAGILRGAVVGSLGFEPHYVHPQTWKRAMGTSADKDLSLARARALFPDHLPTFKLKKFEGRAEATLIAAWGCKQLGIRL